MIETSKLWKFDRNLQFSTLKVDKLKQKLIYA